MIKTILKYFDILFLFYSFIIIFGCANQLPPTGGDDDKSPPKIVKITPPRNTINYSGNNIEIDFNEYVDHRSLKESFFVSPKPDGELEFNWSGTKVEINFPKGLKKNKTYTFLIGKGLKDIHGNNITDPIEFALSTGNIIDKGAISGKIFAKNFEKLIIAVYILPVVNDTLINPEKKFPDFFTQVSENGNYYFGHLPSTKCRLIAIRDENKNLLFDKGADAFSVLNEDIFINDSSKLKNINFLFPGYLPDEKYYLAEQFKNNLFADTSNYLLSSVKNNDKDVPIDSKFFFFFKNNTLNRYEIAENIKLYDTLNIKNLKIIYNWQSDSLLEIIPFEKFKYSSSLKFIFDFLQTSKKYYNEFNFSAADERKSGNISGKVSIIPELNGMINIKLFNNSVPGRFYSMNLEKDSLFTFIDIPESQYVLFAFVDSDNNKLYDYGNYFPFKPSERFMIYEPFLNLKGGWTIDNVTISF